ncbi:hypothetical protein [Streptomyces omiyaensis]|uniref:hypothetical protein n=1 Tax=Streptomyces omiyaensis TaxID=68247 RepID=UPI0036FC5AC7
MTTDRPPATPHLRGDEPLPHGTTQAPAAGAPWYAGELYGAAWAGPADAVRLASVRTALRAARGPEGRRVLLGFLEVCEDSEIRVRSLRQALAAQLLTAGDLAGLALRHHDRRVRRLAARVLPELPGAGPLPDRLASADDPAVRGEAVARFRAAGRTDALAAHLADPSPWVRGLARAGLREAGDDPHARLRTLCADPAAVTPPAVSGLAEERDPADVPLLRTLTGHADGGVRARALDGLRLLGALTDAELPPYADDPDPRVGAIVLRTLRDDPEALRGLLGHRHARVRARALSLLHRHGAVGWDEALTHFADPAPEAARAARRVLSSLAHGHTTERLVALAAPGGTPALRALAMDLLGHRYDDRALLHALRLLDDPQPGVRAAARRQARRLRRWSDASPTGLYGEEIRALYAAHPEFAPRRCSACEGPGTPGCLA